MKIIKKNENQIKQKVVAKKSIFQIQTWIFTECSSRKVFEST